MAKKFRKVAIRKAIEKAQAEARRQEKIVKKKAKQ